MRTRLSSSFTPLYRTLFPVLWIVGFGISVALLWAGIAASVSVPLSLASTAVWLAGGALLLRLRRALRHVWLDGDTLVVEGRHGGRRIPLRAVDEVRELPLSNPRMVRLRARRSDGSEKRFLYVARWRLALPFDPHPDVRDLRERVRAARAEGSERVAPSAAGLPPAP